MTEPSGTQPALDHLINDTRDRLRAPWAAGIAGLVFAVLFVVALVLMRSVPIYSAGDEAIAAWFASGSDIAIVIAALYCIPLAAVMFLWFVAVIRDQIGDREDQFFATVFFGSGLLFVALLFLEAAVAGSLVVGVRYLGQAPPDQATVDLIRSLAYTVMFAMATRAAAVFMIATATVGYRSGVFPRWFAIVGYAIGLILLFVVSFFDWVVLLIPAWVAFVSLVILSRQRRRRTASVAR
jgi:hypothetical protein